MYFLRGDEFRFSDILSHMARDLGSGIVFRKEEMISLVCQT